MPSQRENVGQRIPIPLFFLHSNLHTHACARGQGAHPPLRDPAATGWGKPRRISPEIGCDVAYSAEEGTGTLHGSMMSGVELRAHEVLFSLRET